VIVSSVNNNLQALATLATIGAITSQPVRRRPVYFKELGEFFVERLREGRRWNQSHAAMIWLSGADCRPGYPDARALLQHWMDSPLGSAERASITRPQVLAQLATWEEAGVAASSINHRLLELRNLYRELDAKDPAAYNPSLDIRKRREPEPAPRAVSYDLIEAIIAFMPDRGRTLTPGTPRPTSSHTKARARVMAWTGLPPAQVMKIQPGDVDWNAGTLNVTPRRKGKGTKGRTIPLLPQAVEALKWFFACGAAGPYSTSGFYKTWRTAQRRLVRELRKLAAQQGQDPGAVKLPPIRPYDLRHSFGAEAVRRSGNLLGVQTLMLHARLSTTERYLKSALDHSAQQVIEMWGDRVGAAKP
jgi:integrase/recombinase XerC